MKSGLTNSYEVGKVCGRARNVRAGGAADQGLDYWGNIVVLTQNGAIPKTKRLQKRHPVYGNWHWVFKH